MARKGEVMGVYDAAAAAIGGVMDGGANLSTVDWLRERVAEAAMPDAVVHEGSELFGVKPHLAEPKQILNTQLDEAWTHIEEATQICWEVLAVVSFKEPFTYKR